MEKEPFTITVGARKSPLSRVQVKEILIELHHHHPHIVFKEHLLETKGDIDQKTSLRTMDKTNFFTKEVDELLLAGRSRIAIHSAKDLPEPIPEGLCIIALTKGVDPADVLVMRPGMTVQTLPKEAVIATSSERREQAVRQLRHDLRFIDLRGTIEQRLQKLERAEADGVVVAEAALIRLGLAHLNRVRLPGSTAALQGQLAVMARENDREMAQLFACIDSRIMKR